MADVHPLQGLKDQYDVICKERDKVYAMTAKDEEELTKVNDEINILTAKQTEITARIDAVYARTDFLQVKKQIARLAKALGEPGGLLATTSPR